jgi:hypothetical protein
MVPTMLKKGSIWASRDDFCNAVKRYDDVRVGIRHCFCSGLCWVLIGVLTVSCDGVHLCLPVAGAGVSHFCDKQKICFTCVPYQPEGTHSEEET